MITKRDTDFSSIPLHWMAWYDIFMGIRTGLIDSETLDDLSDTINELSIVSSKIALEKPDDSELNLSLASACLENVIGEYRKVAGSPILTNASTSVKESIQIVIDDFSSAQLLLNNYDNVISRMCEEEWINRCQGEPYSSYSFLPFYEILKPLLDQECEIEDFTSCINIETTRRVKAGIVDDPNEVKKAWKDKLLYGENKCPQIDFIPKNEAWGATHEWDMYEEQYCGDLKLKYKSGYSITIKLLMILLNRLRGRLDGRYQYSYSLRHNGDGSTTDIKVPYIDELYKRIDWNNYLKKPWLKLYRPYFVDEDWNDIVGDDDQLFLSNFIERPVFSNIIKDYNLHAISDVFPMIDKSYYISKLHDTKEMPKLLEICNKESLFFQAHLNEIKWCFMDDQDISSFKRRLTLDNRFYDEGELLSDIFRNQKCQYSKDQLVYALDVVGALYMAIGSIERQAIRQIDVEYYVQKCIEQDHDIIEIIKECIDSSSLTTSTDKEDNAENTLLRKAIDKGLVDKNGMTSKATSEFAADLVLRGIVAPKRGWAHWVNLYRTSKDLDSIADKILEEREDFRGQWKPLNNIFKSNKGTILSARELNQAFMDYKKSYIIKGNQKILVRTGAKEVIKTIIQNKFTKEQAN